MGRSRRSSAMSRIASARRAPSPPAASLYVVGMFMIALATEGVMLTLGNVVCGIGMAAAGFGPIFGSISRQTPAAETLDRARRRDRRRIVRSVRDRAVRLAAAVSARQLAYDDGDPRRRVDADGAACLRIARTTRTAPRLGAAIPQGTRDALHEAFQTQGFWLLTIGFFVCGFHVTFIGLHLPSYISDNAVGMSFFGTPVSAARARRLGDRPRRPVQHRRLAALGLARRPISEEGHAGAALRPARGRLRRYFSLCRCRGSRCCCSRPRSASSGSARFR